MSDKNSYKQTASTAFKEEAPNPIQWSNTSRVINIEFTVHHGPTRDLGDNANAKFFLHLYLTNKPDKFGIKVCLLADANMYYISRFQVQLGKNHSNNDFFRRKGLGYYIV